MENSKKNNRFLGKLKTMTSQYGPYQKIMLDNIYATNKDGSENKYYKGNLVWFDQETGKKYLVKQLGFTVPRDGMKQADIDRGCSHFVTVDLANEYDSEELP